MGQDIVTSHFQDQDFVQFRARMRQEMLLLAEWFRNGTFIPHGWVGGFELEAWLVDPQGQAAPLNEVFLNRMQHPLVVSELAQYNIELNGSPQPLHRKALSLMTTDLSQTWGLCRQTAQDLHADLAMVGILPSVQPSQLDLAHISPKARYLALNDQLMAHYPDLKNPLAIEGKDPLQLVQTDIMLESATTSFQIHLQVDPQQAVRVFNAASVISAALVAVSANSPYLFGHDLWDETRIPVFEQAVDGLHPSRERVTFGRDYVRESWWECFLENEQHYPVLLPLVMDTEPEQMAHLRLHNGTIWRWNRPLLGFDADGSPHLRLEHRVVPAGPTIVDMFANAALFFGLVRVLATQAIPPETLIPFATARHNFYQAARFGLSTDIQWQGQSLRLDRLLQESLLPIAYQGLADLNLDPADIGRFLSIVEGRIRTGQTGSQWQRAFVARYGSDMPQLVRAYLERQESGVPVHEWDL